MGDLTNFARGFLKQTAQKAQEVPKVKPGDSMWWRAMDGKERGPVIVEAVLVEGMNQWIGFTYERLFYLINARLVTKLERL